MATLPMRQWSLNHVTGLLLGRNADFDGLNRFNQPVLLAFVVAGAVGGLVAGSEAAMAIANGPLIEGFAEIGIVLLLFMAGMSVNLREITNRSKLVLYNGIGQLVANDCHAATSGWHY